MTPSGASICSIGFDHLRQQFEQADLRVRRERRQDTVLREVYWSLQALARFETALSETEQANPSVGWIFSPLNQTHLIELVHELPGIGSIDADSLAQSALIDPRVPLDRNQHCVLRWHQSFLAHNLVHGAKANLVEAPRQMPWGGVGTR
jgi:hypothetical protein